MGNSWDLVVIPPTYVRLGPDRSCYLFWDERTNHMWGLYGKTLDRYRNYTLSRATTSSGVYALHSVPMLCYDMICLLSVAWGAFTILLRRGVMMRKLNHAPKKRTWFFLVRSRKRWGRMGESAGLLYGSTSGWVAFWTSCNEGTVVVLWRREGHAF